MFVIPGGLLPAVFLLFVCSSCLSCFNVARYTAILYWTYRAELTNDRSFRVNQK